MISPYLVSYTAMGSMLQKKSNAYILSVFAMTPLCLVYFLVLDVVFMMYAVINYLICLVQ